jgi:hypothetical protein
MGLSKSKGGMGFRDLAMFNKALLAKQLWRIMQNPDSLVAKIMKAKYFPRSDLFEAKLGSRPSLAWRSMLSARELVHQGAVWRIGNGEQVSGCQNPQRFQFTYRGCTCQLIQKCVI